MCSIYKWTLLKSLAGFFMQNGSFTLSVRPQWALKKFMPWVWFRCVNQASCSHCNLILSQMSPECWRQTHGGNNVVQATRQIYWVLWTLSQLCHLVSMWTHCLRHQLVASTFAVSARVRRTFLLPSCSRTLCDSTSGLSTVNIFLALFSCLCKKADCYPTLSLYFKVLLIPAPPSQGRL